MNSLVKGKEKVTMHEIMKRKEEKKKIPPALHVNANEEMPGGTRHR